MARETYKQAYATAKLDLLEQLQKRDDLDQKIRKLKQTVKALGELCGAPAEEIDKLLLVEGFAIDAKPGFTESIRRLFRIHQTALSRSEEHTSELQSHVNLVCRLLLEKKKKKK